MTDTPRSLSHSLPPKKQGFESNTVVPTGFPSPVNLLLITGRSDWAHAPRQVMEIAKMMKGLGARVAIAAPSDPPLGTEFRKTANHFVSIERESISLRDFLRLARAIKNLEINVIHSHGRIGGIYSRLLGLITKTPVVHSFHGLAPKTGPKGRFYNLLERVLGQMVFSSVFSSSSESEQIFSAGLARRIGLPTILEKALDLKGVQKRIRAPFAGGPIRIGSIARVGRANGPDLLLKLASEFATNGVWTTSGLSKNQLERYGKVPEKFEAVPLQIDLIKWLQSLDVFVCTSRDTGHANGVLEALAAGVPCILSDIPAHRDFASAQAALLFDPEDISTFKKHLADLTKDVALRSSLTLNGTYYLERFHNWDKFRDGLIEIYRSTIRGY